MTEPKTKKKTTRRKATARKKAPKATAGEPAAPLPAAQVDVKDVTFDETAATDAPPDAAKTDTTPKRRTSRGRRKSAPKRGDETPAAPVVTDEVLSPPSTAAGKPVEAEAIADTGPSESAESPAETKTEKPPRGRRRGRRPAKKVEAVQPDEDAPASVVPDTPTEEAEPTPSVSPEDSESPPTKSRSRRGRGRGRGRGRNASQANDTATVERSDTNQEKIDDAPAADENKNRGSSSRRGGRKSKTARPDEGSPAPAPAKKAGSREMLINVSAGDECRIAVLQNKRLEELFIERTSSQSHVGNIYKGRVTNIEASIQAAFVDFGLPQKNGFLHISDVQPQYFPDHTGEKEEVGRKIPRHLRPPIQKCFRRGQEVIVQVIKDGLGTKGPTLTTYLSIPGRFLVMMPGMQRHGVSRKIEDEAERRTMRDLLGQLDLPTGVGFIMRTAGLGRTKRELQRDLTYLLRLWKTVVDRVKRLDSPAELYRESDLVTRTIRDVFTADFSRVLVDDPDTAAKAREFLQIAMPRSKTMVDLYTEREPLFHRYHVEEEIERINMRQVPLPSGGSLVIDSTEALVAIDVNSGRARVNDDAEETAFATNLEAADEIARQLRLRDLGGLVVCDFIDMRSDRHQRAVRQSISDEMKKHKQRARVAPRISGFGLLEMTRQRQGPSLKRNIYFDCPHCKGSGLVKTADSVILDVIRIIQLATHHEQVQRVTITVAANVAYQILNTKRATINAIEMDTGKEIIVRGDDAYTSDQVEAHCEDSRNRTLDVIPKSLDDNTSRRRGRGR